MSVVLVSPAEVRAAIAARVLGPPDHDDALGGVRLHPHQLEGVERCRRLLREHGGAMLSDDVGLGKTYVALRLAREAASTLVVAPAALRDAWTRSAATAKVAIDFVSVEALSRSPANGRAAFVVVDEAHHLRNPATARHHHAVETCRSAKVLLLSATPLQNRLDDLRAQLALFMGTRALQMDADELARYVVRRTDVDIDVALPDVEPPRWIEIADDSDCLDRLLALPPPVPPSDGGDAGALLAYTLVRQWASSRAALVATLRRRLAVARAMEDALVDGRMPSRRDLASWRYADGVQQLSLAALLDQATAGPGLLAQVQRHADAVRETLAWLRTTTDPDAERADAIVATLRTHPEERVVAFTEFADTARALFRRLRLRHRAALLTHAGAEVAGGRMTRRELLHRFAQRDVSAAERVDLLITTDVLSEGVDLQTASVVVHLDLPWNPARLTQRVGRLRRLNAARDRVAVYLCRPPTPAERFLEIDRRLRDKVRRAAHTVGVAGSILPNLVSDVADAATAREERIAATLRGWRGPVPDRSGDIRVAAVRARRDGALVLCGAGDDVTLLSVRGDVVTDDRAVLGDLLPEATGDAVCLSDVALAAALRDIERGLDRRQVGAVIDLGTVRLARSRASLLRRVDRIARRAPRHAQVAFAPLLQRARATASAVLSAGAERVLDELTHAELEDGPWLRAVGEFAALHARPQRGVSRLLAMLLLVRDRD